MFRTLRTLLKEVKEYKRASIATPVYMILEVAMEMVIPFLMASIIDDGVNAGNMAHIYKVGCFILNQAKNSINQSQEKKGQNNQTGKNILKKVLP